MDAYCNNPECEKDSWRLQKHPDDYARGVTCPECGTTRVDVPDAEPRGQEQRQQGGGQRQAAPRDRRPARREERERAPARSEGGGSSAASDLIAVMDDDVDPERRAQGAKSVLGFLGNFAAEAIRYNDQKQQARDQRAQGVDVAPTDQYPECVDCAYQFTGEDIGLSDDEVKCPECGRVHDIIRREDAAE